jgi:signal transduction histidine kinase/DNA-binding NtrC family response regulator/HPt (histidine-containing phosphotransfer) domain-containing protein
MSEKIPISILFISDSINQALVLVKMIEDGGWGVTYDVIDSNVASQFVGHKNYNAVLCDSVLKQFSNDDIFAFLAKINNTTPVIIIEDQDLAAIASKTLMFGGKAVLRNDIDGLLKLLKKSVIHQQFNNKLFLNDLINDMDIPVFICNRIWSVIDGNNAARKLFYAEQITAETSLISLVATNLANDLYEKLLAFSNGTLSTTTKIGGVNAPIHFSSMPSLLFSLDIYKRHENDETFYVVFCRDITNDFNQYRALKNDKHAIEEKFNLQQNAQSDIQGQNLELFKRRYNFLTQISHEIRTPMNAVAGYAETLLKRNTKPETKVIANQIMRASKLLLGVVNDILDFSRIESDQMQLSSDVFLMADVLDDVAIIMSSTAKAKDIELSISTPPVSDITLRGDPIRLRQILINITSNAVKFTDKGSVEVVLTELDRTPLSVTYRFSVSDTGLGMSPEQLKAISEPFVQGSVEISKRFGGSGLGLFISRSLIAKMGGELIIKSSEGKGSRLYFDLSFPIIKISKTIPESLMSLNVLIVDDNSLVLESMATTVASLGWRPSKFVSAEALMRWLERHPSLISPNTVILSDWYMPEIDGFELAERLNKLYSPEQCPKFFITTTHDHVAYSEFLNKGIVIDVLNKPVSPGTLFKAISSAFNKSDLVKINDLLKLKDIKLLIVDDSEMNRDLLATVFEDEGAIVTLASSPRKCLEILENRQDYDVILMDILMPEMTGFELTQLLKNKRDTAGIPIVGISARFGEDEYNHAKAVGMSGWLTKPISIDRVLAVIANVTHMEFDVDDNWHFSQDGDIFERWADLPLLNDQSEMILFKTNQRYLQMLKKFSNNYQLLVKDLSSANAVDSEFLKRRVHKIVGSASSLGLERLAAFCGLLDSMQADEGFKPSYQNTLEDLLKGTLLEIKNYLGVDSLVAESLSDEINISQKELNEILTHLKIVLSQGDSKAIDEAMKHVAEIGLLQLHQKLEPLIDDIEYKAAMNIVADFEIKSPQNLLQDQQVGEKDA